jgi:UDP:flavonoid glycosyltransferase YjiC (YdhE family)
LFIEGKVLFVDWGLWALQASEFAQAAREEIDMSKILALMNAHALAHVSRPLEIAKVLRNRGAEMIFAGYGKYLEVAAKAGFETVELPYISEKQLVEATRSQRLDKLFKEEQIAGFIEAELALYKRLHPDLVIIDNRPSAVTSAELMGIKTIGIINVHMSQYKEIPFYSFRNVTRLGAKEPFKYLDRIENVIEGFLIDNLVMRDIGKLRRRYGLKKKHGFANEEGDLNLFPDLPEFSPVSKPPDNAHYVGPLTWHNDLPAPESLKQIDDAKKCIYFTIGSSGLEELIENVQEFLAEDIPIIIAAGKMKGTKELSLPPNVFLEEFVNTDMVLPRCNLVVCHGGNGTIYQALSHGVPIVGIAMHEEQYYGLKRVNNLELGIGFHAKKLRKKGFQLLARSIQEVLHNEKYKKNAQRFQNLIMQNGNSAEKAADIIEDYIGH